MVEYFVLYVGVHHRAKALAAYGVDGSIPLLTTSQLDAANKVVKVLKPLEEVTKCISKDDATISLVIPLLYALQKTLGHDDNGGVQNDNRNA